MEISPDELCSMIFDPSESSPDEVLELVESYLPTTTDLLIEAVYKRVTSCADRCKSKQHLFCNRMIRSLLHQLEILRKVPDFLSPEGKKCLDEMEAMLPK